MLLNKKEIQILSIVVAVWGLFLISSGTIMSQSKKVVVKKIYNIDVSTKQISEIQAKKHEIILKDITIEEGEVISTDIKDYIENPDKIEEEMLNLLAQGLDTSTVNVNKPGTYNYSITYKKKIYQAKIIVKEKELPKIILTLKEKNMPTTGTISRNIRDYIYEDITDEIYNNMILDLTDVIEHQKIPGRYKYSITYNDTIYYGDYIIHEPVETKVTVILCPEDATIDPNNKTCICQNGTYDEEEGKCITEED